MTMTHNRETNQFFALKILGADCYGTIHHIFEREILQRLKNGDTGQLGYEQICHLVDDFEHEGPNGTHVCLIFELIGENLRSFSAWFPESRLPNQVMRRFTIQLLLALDYAHDNNVVHTGCPFPRMSVMKRFLIETFARHSTEQYFCQIQRSNSYQIRLPRQGTQPEARQS